MDINFKKQSGLSLIELMIASTLSLIIIGGVVQVFVGTKATYITTENIGRAQENGRFAIDVLSRYTRIAGYWDYNTNDSTPEPFVPDCATAGDPCSQDGTGNNNSDRLAIQFDAPDNLDCNGQTPSANRVLSNVFWVQDDGFGVSSLYCRGFDQATNTWLGTAQPYISGIDSMQLLYGIQDNTGSVTNYVNASRVTNWSDIRAIKISILAQSGTTGSANFDDRTYVLLDSAPLTFTDGQARYIFSTTFFVSNT